MTKVMVLLETEMRDELMALGRKGQTYDLLLHEIIHGYHQLEQNGEGWFDVFKVTKILIIGGAATASIGAAGGGNILELGLDCSLFVVGIFRGIRSERQIPVLDGGKSEGRRVGGDFFHLPFTIVFAAAIFTAAIRFFLNLIPPLLADRTVANYDQKNS